MSGDETGDSAESGLRAIRPFLGGTLFEDRSLFDMTSRSLRPLFKIQTTSEAVTVTFDLPFVEKKDISVTTTENTLSVDAKMRKTVTMRVGGTVQRRVQFERYTRHISLPVRVKPESAKATFRNGLLRVKIPVAKKGTKVKVGP